MNYIKSQNQRMKIYINEIKSQNFEYRVKDLSQKSQILGILKSNNNDNVKIQAKK